MFRIGVVGSDGGDLGPQDTVIHDDSAPRYENISSAVGVAVLYCISFLKENKVTDPRDYPALIIYKEAYGMACGQTYCAVCPVPDGVVEVKPI